MRGGRVEACRAFLDGIAESERRSPEHLWAVVHYHYRLGEFAKAVSVYQELLRLGPTHFDEKTVEQRSIFYDCCAHLGWTEPACEAAKTIAPRCNEASAIMVKAEALLAMGLDEEAAAITKPFERRDHSAIVTQLILCQAMMRRKGIQHGLAAYALAMTNPHAWVTLYGEDPQYPMADYWHGQSFLPKRLILRTRGGVGDTLQWMRYLPFLHAVGVELSTDGRLPGIGIKTLTEPVDIARAHARLGQWGEPLADRTMWTDPFALFTGLFEALGYADAPQGHLSTSPDADAEAHLRAIRAKAGGRPAVAITWSSNDGPWLFASKSLTLDQVRPLLAMEDIHWVVLQRGLQRDAWLAAPEASKTTILPTTFSFNQTGVLLQGLDAAVTNCSSIVHLSGGLGCETFLLASAAADWRWESFPSFTPWSQHTLLFRQPKLGDWDTAVERLRTALTAWVAARRDRLDVASTSAVG